MCLRRRRRRSWMMVEMVYLQQYSVSSGGNQQCKVNPHEVSCPEYDDTFHQQ
jgi:hypothetical protein